MIRPTAIAGAFLALAVTSCAGDNAPAPTLAAAGPGPGATSGRPSNAAVAACRQRANEIYLRQNRVILSQQNQSLSPYSSTGLPDNPAQGLGERFGRDQDFADCLRGFGPAAPGSATPVSAGAPGAGTGVSPAMSPSGRGGPVTIAPPH